MIFSGARWAAFNALADDETDVSGDAPELTNEFFARAQVLLPGEITPQPRKAKEQTVTIKIKLDQPLLAWFQAQGEGYEQKMLAALRLYAQAHQSIGH